MQLDTLKAYIDKRKDFKEPEDYNIKKRKDGFLEFVKKDKEKTSKQIDCLQLEYNDFRVSFHTFQNKDFLKYKTALSSLKTYFDSIDVTFLKKFNEENCFTFDIGIFNEPKHQSEQVNQFLKHYKNWYFFEFDFNFENLFSIQENRLFLEKRHIYQIYDRDWPQTKFFTKNLSTEKITKIFNLLEVLCEQEYKIFKAMRETRDRFFKKQKEAWAKALAV